MGKKVACARYSLPGGAAVASCGVELWNDDFWTGPHYIKCTHHPQIERMPGACHGGHFHSFDALSALAL